MLKQKISYTDYNGNTREDEYEFNLTRSEVIRMNVGFKGGLIPNLEAILYGSESVEPRLPMPDEVYTLMKSST